MSNRYMRTLPAFRPGSRYTSCGDAQIPWSVYLVTAGLLILPVFVVVYYGVKRTERLEFNRQHPSQAVVYYGGTLRPIELETAPTFTFRDDYPQIPDTQLRKATLEVQDPHTGVRVQISDGGQWLRAVSADGRILWCVNVVREQGQDFVGWPVISRFRLSGHDILFGFGKHSFGRVGLASGRVEFLGSD
jgi:hypothetical protein